MSEGQYYINWYTQTFRPFTKVRLCRSVLMDHSIIQIDNTLVFSFAESNLYIYKVGAFFDLGNRTPPRPLALEG